MGEKLESYLQIPSLETYIILEQSTAAANVFHRDDNGRFQRQSYVGIDAVVPTRIDSCELKLSEVYEKVEFSEEADAD